MRRKTLLLLSILLLGCGGGEREGSGAGNPGDPPAEALRSPDSLRVHDSLPPADSLSLPDSLTDVAPGDEESESETGRSYAATPNNRFPRPEFIRGIYLNAWTSGSTRRREALITLARRTELNAFVIDIKDATGYVSHDTRVPLAREVGADGEIRIRDLPGLLTRLQEAGIYPIARIVVAKDPILTEGRPDLAIQDSAGGVWLDQDSVRWLNFHDRRVWEYHVALAKEVVDLGFPEVQWDYVRFPDAPEAYLGRAVFPGAGGRTRVDAVRGFLGYSREVLAEEAAVVTADVFGVTTSYRRDVGIGQLWESMIDRADVLLPMVYTSHYWSGSFGFEKPNAYPYEIVRRALRDAQSRSAEVEGAGLTRPWLQDFTLGDPPYDAPEVRAQIQATYDAGIQEWILWNPGSRYTQSALMPRGGLPSWIDPVMRVGGKVVPISERFEILGETPPEGGSAPEDTLIIPDLVAPSLGGRPKEQTPPAVPIPDTGGVNRSGG
jgi:hypothetical protein